MRGRRGLRARRRRGAAPSIRARAPRIGAARGKAARGGGVGGSGPRGTSGAAGNAGGGPAGLGAGGDAAGGGQREVSLTLHTHDERYSTLKVVVNPEFLPSVRKGHILEIEHADEEQRRSKLLLEVKKIEKLSGNLQISILKSIASLFDFQARAKVIVRVAQADKISVDFVELSFRDQYISRGDMWMFTQGLQNQCIYQSQEVEAHGFKAQVNEILVEKEKTRCGLIGRQTKLVFRSRSAKIYLLFQMSEEMWYYSDMDSESYFQKALYGFLQTLLDKWRELQVNHQVTVIFFARTIYQKEISTTLTSPPGLSTLPDGRLYRDIYKVVLDSQTGMHRDRESLFKLLRSEFIQFPQIAGWNAPEPKHGLRGAPSLACDGNLLEAINLVEDNFDQHYVNRDLKRTGLSAIIVTAGSGVFNVDKSLSQLTKQRIIDAGAGCDIICVAPAPTHMVPLFIFDAPTTSNALPSPAVKGLTPSNANTGTGTSLKSSRGAGGFFQQPRSSGAGGGAGGLAMPSLSSRMSSHTSAAAAAAAGQHGSMSTLSSSGSAGLSTKRHTPPNDPANDASGSTGSSDAWCELPYYWVQMKFFHVKHALLMGVDDIDDADADKAADFDKHRVPPSQHLVPSHRMFNLGRRDAAAARSVLAADLHTPTSQPSRSLRDFQDAKRSPFGVVPSPAPSSSQGGRDTQFHMEFLSSHLLHGNKSSTKLPSSPVAVDDTPDASPVALLSTYGTYRSTTAPHGALAVAAAGAFGAPEHRNMAGPNTEESDHAGRKTPKRRRTQKYELDSSVFRRPLIPRDRPRWSVPSIFAQDDSPPFAHYSGRASGAESPSMTPERSRSWRKGQPSPAAGKRRTSAARALFMRGAEHEFSRPQLVIDGGFTRSPLFGDPLFGLGTDLASPRIPGFDFLPAAPPPLNFSPPRAHSKKRSVVNPISAAYSLSGVTPMSTVSGLSQSQGRAAVPTSSPLQSSLYSHGIGIPQSSWESGATTPTVAAVPIPYVHRAGASRRPPTQADLDGYDFKVLSSSRLSDSYRRGVFHPKHLLAHSNRDSETPLAQQPLSVSTPSVNSTPSVGSRSYDRTPTNLSMGTENVRHPRYSFTSRTSPSPMILAQQPPHALYQQHQQPSQQQQQHAHHHHQHHRYGHSRAHREPHNYHQPQPSLSSTLAMASSSSVKMSPQLSTLTRQYSHPSQQHQSYSNTSSTGVSYKNPSGSLPSTLRREHNPSMPKTMQMPKHMRSATQPPIVAASSKDIGGGGGGASSSSRGIPIPKRSSTGGSRRSGGKSDGPKHSSPGPGGGGGGTTRSPMGNLLSPPHSLDSSASEASEVGGGGQHSVKSSSGAMLRADSIAMPASSLHANVGSYRNRVSRSYENTSYMQTLERRMAVRRQKESSQSPPPRHFARDRHALTARSRTAVSDRGGSGSGGGTTHQYAATGTTAGSGGGTGTAIGSASSIGGGGFAIAPRAMSDVGSTSSGSSDHKSSSASSKARSAKRRHAPTKKRSLDAPNPFTYITQMSRPRDGRWNHLYSSVEEYASRTYVSSDLTDPTQPHLWNAIMKPAILPLSTDSKSVPQDSSDKKQLYTYQVLYEGGAYFSSLDNLFDELMIQRLCYGFQLVVSESSWLSMQSQVIPFKKGGTGKKCYNLYLNGQFHTLTVTDQSVVEVSKFIQENLNQKRSLIQKRYNYSLWSTHTNSFAEASANIRFREKNVDVEWNNFDFVVAGLNEMDEGRKSIPSKAIRFAIIPTLDSSSFHYEEKSADPTSSPISSPTTGSGSGSGESPARKRDIARATQNFKEFMATILDQDFDDAGIFIRKQNQALSPSLEAGSTRFTRLQLRSNWPSRVEWINLYYEKVHDPFMCYHIEIHWLVASGMHVSEWVRNTLKSAKDLDINVVPVPIQVSKTNPLQGNPFRKPHLIDFPSAVLPQVRRALLTKFDFFYDTFPEHSRRHRAAGFPRAPSSRRTAALAADSRGRGGSPDSPKKSSLARSLEACGKSSGASSVKSQLSHSLAQHRKKEAAENSPRSPSGGGGGGGGGNRSPTVSSSAGVSRSRSSSVAVGGTARSPRSSPAATAASGSSADRSSSPSLSPSRSKSDFDVLKGTRAPMSGGGGKKRGSAESKASKNRGSDSTSSAGGTTSVSASLAQFASKVTNVDFKFKRNSTSGAGGTSSQSTSPSLKRKKNASHSTAFGALTRAFGGGGSGAGGSGSGGADASAEQQQHDANLVGGDRSSTAAAASSASQLASHESPTKVTPPRGGLSRQTQLTSPHARTEPRLRSTGTGTGGGQQSPMKRTAASVVNMLLRSPPHTNKSSNSTVSAVAKRWSPSKRKRPNANTNASASVSHDGGLAPAAVSASKATNGASAADLGTSRSRDLATLAASVTIPPKTRPVRRSLFDKDGLDDVEPMLHSTMMSSIREGERRGGGSPATTANEPPDELADVGPDAMMVPVDTEAEAEAKRESESESVPPLDENFREFFLHTSGCALVIMKKDTLLWVENFMLKNQDYAGRSAAIFQEVQRHVQALNSAHVAYGSDGAEGASTDAMYS